jgi:hypothetical protein
MRSAVGETVGAGWVQVVTRAAAEAVEPPALRPDERDGATYFLSRLRDGRPIEGRTIALPVAADGD